MVVFWGHDFLISLEGSFKKIGNPTNGKLCLLLHLHEKKTGSQYVEASQKNKEVSQAWFRKSKQSNMYEVIFFSRTINLS